VKRIYRVNRRSKERLLNELLTSGRKAFTMTYSMDTPLTVSRPVVLDLLADSGASIPIQSELRYDAADPYAVTLAFMTSTSQVCWTFGRELLSDGLFEPSGDGDVHVWPCLDADANAVVIIELCSPEGEALVQARTGDLSRFVAQMSALVPVGDESEHINIDATIAALLAAPAA